MLNRRRWGAWCACGIFGVGAGSVLAQARSHSPLSGQPAPGFSRISIAVDDRSAFCVLPLTIAERLGFFSAEGLTVTVKEHADAQAAVQSVLSGSSQVLSGSYASVLLLQARGLAPMSSFVLQGRTPQLVLGVSSQVLPGFRSLASLEGLRVGISGLNTGSHRVARLVLQRAGLPSSQVRYVAVPQHERALRAFRTGEVDAICHTDPTVTMLEREGGLKVVADTRTVRGNAEVFGGPLPAACLAAPSPWLDRHPDVAQSLAHAMVHALKWLQTAGPSDIIRVVPESYFMGDRALYLAAFSRAREAWTPDGVMPVNGPVTLVNTLNDLGDLPEVQGLHLDSTYTNRFALKAKVRFRA